MVYDGDCHFCRRWIARWAQMTGDRVIYRPSQAAAKDFPEIPPEEFAQEVKLVEPDRQNFGGAAAVFRVLAGYGEPRWLWAVPWWLFRRVGLFRWVTETAYKFVAEHRMLFSTLTRWLFGKDVRQPTYFTARDWFLRGLGLVFLALFLMMGSLPKGINSSADGWLPLLRWIGAVASMLLVVDVAPGLCLALSCFCYLTIEHCVWMFAGVGLPNFELEIGLLGLFVVPWRLVPGWKQKELSTPAPLAAAGVFILRLALFWMLLRTALHDLDRGSYILQHSPTLLRTLHVLGLVAPFLILGPRKVRSGGLFLVLLGQLTSFLEGGFDFPGVTIIALCVLLLDDLQWPTRLRCRTEIDPHTRQTKVAGWRWPDWVLIPTAAGLILFPLFSLKVHF